MKDGIVFRQGRTVRVSDKQKGCENWCFFSVLFPMIATIALIAMPAKLFETETFFQKQQVAFNEVGDQVVDLPDVQPHSLRSLQDGDLVHFSNAYNATVTDANFGITLDHALKLQRDTEYCQWHESSSDSCDTCTSQGSNGETESHDCNCVRTYSYVKMWSRHRIISFGFDQPANHHNPQRDPYPSSDFISDDTTSGDLQLSREIIGNLRARLDPVTFSHNGKPIEPGMLKKFWNWMFGEPSTRFESTQNLHRFARSRASEQDHFVFTNTYEGWFFSAYEEETWMRVLRGFGQFVEGSALDWQIGDLYDMWNGCTPGDIRVRYSVADPEIISVVAGVSSKNKLGPYVATTNGFSIGLAHAGELSSDAMFAAESAMAWRSCKFARFGNVLSGAAAIYLLVHFSVWAPKDALSICGAIVGTSLVTMAAVWASVYGLSDWNGSHSDIWTVVAVVTGLVVVGISFFDGRAVGTSSKQKAA